jgi:hypothetical protein
LKEIKLNNKPKGNKKLEEEKMKIRSKRELKWRK